MSQSKHITKIFNSKKAEKRNALILIHGRGETGVGKSYMAMSIAEMHDLKFTVDNIVFHAPQFFQRLQTAPTDAIIIFDDAGVEANAREWMTQVNRVIIKTLQMFRKKRIHLIVTVPHITQIDSNIRMMADCEISVLRRGYGRAYRFIKSSFTGNCTTHFLFSLGDPDRHHTWMKLPQRVDVEEYERRKDAAINTWLERFYETSEKYYEAPKKKLSVGEIVEEIKKQGVENYYNKKGRLDKFLIGAKFEVSTPKAYQVASLLERK